MSVFEDSGNEVAVQGLYTAETTWAGGDLVGGFAPGGDDRLDVRHHAVAEGRATFPALAA